MNYTPMSPPNAMHSLYSWSNSRNNSERTGIKLSKHENMHWNSSFDAMKQIWDKWSLLQTMESKKASNEQSFPNPLKNILNGQPSWRSVRYFTWGNIHFIFFFFLHPSTIISFTKKETATYTLEPWLFFHLLNELNIYSIEKQLQIYFGKKVQKQQKRPLLKLCNPF